MKLLHLLSSITLLLLLQGCDQAASVSELPVSRPVKLFSLENTQLLNAVVPGRLEANQRAELAFDVAGRLTTLPATEGQRVTKNQLLAQLNDTDFRSKLRSAEAEYQRANADYQRGKTLFENKKAISQAELEKLRAQAAVTKATLEQARKAVSDTRLLAPFDGVVSKVLVNNHENINAKQAVVIMQDLQSFEIRLQITEKQLLSSERQMNTLYATVSGIPNREFALKFKTIATEPDAVTGTYEAVLTMPAPDDLPLLPGMTVSVSARTATSASSDTLHVPAVAVLQESGSTQHYVWRYNAQLKQAQKTAVELGALQGEYVVINKGLQPNDQIIVAGIHAVRDGMPVHPLQ
ncbi:MAG: efflux RND transporter periplasmic adaptor subunit [Plesiomonas sp.]|uniref:efflux RND transporter periplasmic adaptor subunit n=1 Tax=Plesiomonas sp. TaxID=2486279 RepID=UPI003F410C70